MLVETLEKTSITDKSFTNLTDNKFTIEWSIFLEITLTTNKTMVDF